PTVAFCPAALFLLAATGRPESLHILWTHANLGDVERRRAALYAIAQLDPDDALNELLNGLADLPLVLPAPRGPFGPQKQTEPAELTIGIPFERLETIARTGKVKIAVMALKLLGHHKDEQTVEFLISQLSRRLWPIRETALAQLRRRGAAQAADAV